MVLAPWSAHARTTLAGLNIATAIASLASSLAVIACGIVAPGFTKGTYAYVKRLAACDGLFALACVMGDRGRDSAFLDSPSAACVIQGVGIQFFGVASALFTTCISHACASSMKHGRAIGAKKDTIGRYDAFVFFASAACLAAPLVTQTFGDSRLGRCHIMHGDADETSKAHAATVARLVGYYLPIWACVVYNVWTWSAVWRVAVRVKALDSTLWSAATSSSTDVDDAARRSRVATARLVTFVRRLALYPVWQVLSNVPGTALRVVTLSGASVPLALAASHVVAKTSQGVAHAMIFFYAHPVRDELVHHFRLALGRGYPSSSSASSPSRADDAFVPADVGLRALADDVDFATDDDLDASSYEFIELTTPHSDAAVEA
mmetsp:Transcript_6486/g.23482  ORF Transcript_6486/g.23482 Transcript_6486/m.23482 type:complete len:377 (-) Transcript_6486:103-1233(-)